MPSLRDTIAAVEDIPSESVDVPQWGVKLEVRGTDGTRRAEMLERFTREDGRIDYGELVPALLITCCYDPETGDKVFEDGDKDMLMGKASAALERVSTVAMRLCGIDQDAEARLGKDSSASPTTVTSATPSDASTSS